METIARLHRESAEDPLNESDSPLRAQRGISKEGQRRSILDALEMTVAQRFVREGTHEPLQRASLLGALLLGLAASAVHAQSQPPSLDDQLRAQLALGNADGCVEFLRVPQADIDVLGTQAAVRAQLEGLGSQIGNELRAICGPSAVGSASSLGGALNGLQATKTVSQFRLARRRIDQRLRQRGGQESKQTLMLMLQPAAADSGPELWQYATSGYGVFGELEYENRERVSTRYEDGYKGDVAGGSVGVDLAWDRGIIGAWIGYSRTDADLRGGEPKAFFLNGDTNDELDQILSDQTFLSSVCGGIRPGGKFDLEGGRLGAFFGWKLGNTGFLDASIGRTRRDYSYSRSSCTIEYTGTADFSDVDDIYAGAISGDTTITEDSLSIRSGFYKAVGSWTFGPRAALNYSRSSVDAYAETGRSTVANPVDPNTRGDPSDDVLRTLGGPLGLELAYQEQNQKSLVLEVGGQIERSFEMPRGTLIAHASAYWRHEFDDDRRFSTVQFVQDRRLDPVRFSFASDEIDSDNALFSVGMTALLGERAIVRFEVTHLAFDKLVDSTAFSAQFRVGL